MYEALLETRRVGAPLAVLPAIAAASPEIDARTGGAGAGGGHAPRGRGDSRGPAPVG